MASCAVSNVISKDPRFQELKKAYEGKHYSDDHLAQALQLCREYHAYSDDWYPETPAQKGVFTRFMNHYMSLAKLSKTESDMDRDGIYNLYTTLYDLWTPEQLDARIAHIVERWRNKLDTIQRKDTTGRSRQELIAAQAQEGKNGFQVILDSVFKGIEKRADMTYVMNRIAELRPDATPEQMEEWRALNERRIPELRKILANKNRLAALAAIKIGEEEGFIVNIHNFEIDMSEPTDEDYLEDGSTEEAEDSGEDNEEGTKGERYADFRTLKLMNTLSVKAKQLLSRIPKVDSNGNLMKDDLGYPMTVGTRQAAVVLKRVLVNSTPESMMSDLQAASTMYPWLRGVVDELEKHPDFQTTVYDNFKSAESIYVYSNFENGKYRPRFANSRSQGYALAREAATNLRSGYVLDDEKSIYTGFGSLVSQGRLEELHKEIKAFNEKYDFYLRGINMVEGPSPFYTAERERKAREEDVEYVKRKLGEDADYLLKDGPEAMKGFLDAHPDFPEQVAKYARGVGFAVSAEDVRRSALQTMSPKSYAFLDLHPISKYKDRNKIYHLLHSLETIYRNAAKRGEARTGQYTFNTNPEYFTKVNKCLALAKYDEVEARVVNEGKSLSAYNHVNLLHQTFDQLANKAGLSEEAYQEMLENEYFQYEGMALGSGEHRKISGWLAEFAEADDSGYSRRRDELRVVDMAAVNHVEYAKLSREQKLANSLVMYFQTDGLRLGPAHALYEVPIQSDYSTAYNFVNGPSYGWDTLVDNLTDEVLMELERISALKARLGDDSRIKLKVYEKQGMKLQIFPELNDNGFLEAYSNISDPDEARTYVSSTVDEQLKKVVEKDFALIEETGILARNIFKPDFELYSEKGTIDGLSDGGRYLLRGACANIFYARQQMTKILTGGMHQFNGLIDYEKRNMMTHATRSSLYTQATWNGKRVGKDNQRVVYIGDSVSKSAFLSDLESMCKQLLDAKVISKTQYDAFISAYSDIKTTDGTGLRTLESYRTVMIMADQWDARHESAYNRIMDGKPTKDDIDVFMQNIKPVYTGYEHIPAAAGEGQKPIKLTVLHKYAEMVLLPSVLADKCLSCKSAPMQALDRAQERLKKEGKEIDMFLFHSGVKVGAHSILQPFALDKNEGRILKGVQDIEDYIVKTVEDNDASVHELPFKYYGIAASTPAHAADDRIAWASQAEKVAWANISATDKIDVRGEEVSASDARELYNKIKAAGIIDAYQKIRDVFSNADELERIFQEELANKSYSSRELSYALAHLKDGTFALPLFSPNVEHQVQELLASIIKKRLTKPKQRGVNMLQSTGLGMDIEASAFDNDHALSEDEKLSIVFDGTGENKRVKYVEVYMPIHDSRLKEFADENGNIGPARLNKLIEDGVIPEQILDFIAYRTPSDAEHSVIPCHIKGFIANTAGATIRMPKEVMVMTGHDYDGDKMRCHFPNFTVGWDENKIRAQYEKHLPDDATLVQSILDQNEAQEDLQSYSSFARMIKSPNNPSRDEYRQVKYTAYDYTMDPLDNSDDARANAKIELLFAQLTSPAGSKRMIIPGGCDETKVIAKSLYLVRAATDDTSRGLIREKLEAQGMASDKANDVVRHAVSLYNTLTKKTDSQLTEIMREVSSAETPFSLAHSVDAFEYIMGGSELIGIYAMYNSALQMMQRLELTYTPKQTKSGKPYTVTIFGHTFDKLFDLHNHRGRLASLGLARLLNAAVDNNKDPILGYLNQSKAMAEETFFMFAAGMTEEEIHLVTNQPAVVELIQRTKIYDADGLRGIIQGLIDEISANSDRLGNDISEYSAIKDIASFTREDFIDALDKNYDEVRDGTDFGLKEKQIKILYFLRHIYDAAGDLATFARLTRPESASGAIGTTVASIIAKVVELNKFRNKISSGNVHIAGLEDVLRQRDVRDGMSSKYIEQELGDKLPEVVALNSLMIDTSLDLFRPFFPQARQSWIDLSSEIANSYSYKKLQDGTVQKVGEEMILWKLLGNKKFIQGDPQEEQRRIIIDVPKQLKDLKERISRAEANPGKDSAADALVGNVFLQKLSTTSPENSTIAPRLMFSLNGPAVEGMADSIRAYWGSMLNSEEEGIRKLATDLFKYNLYTNGFSYGMYEFAHFAPFSVIVQTPGYVEALQDILNSNWDDERDRENFINQYYMNHWGDKKFIPQYSLSDINIAPATSGSGMLGVPASTNDPVIIETLQNLRYVILTQKAKNGNGIEQLLYRVNPGDADNPVYLARAQKLGSRNYHGQSTLQYNPAVDYHMISPIIPGNSSAWGQLDKLNVFGGNNNINNPEAAAPARPFQFLQGNAAGGFQPSNFIASILHSNTAATIVTKVEDKVEPVSAKNDEVLPEPNTGEQAPPPTMDDYIQSSGFGFLGGNISMENVDTDLLAQAETRRSSSDDDATQGKMLHILQENEKGEYEEATVPATPNMIREARRQKTFAELNKRLREILREKGINVGVLTHAEQMLNIGGITIFDTPNVTAEGLLEMIRLAEGYQGEYALPEEFAHLALEMLGHDHSLVQRLLSTLASNDEAMQEAYEGMYDEYVKRYGEANKDKLVLEAAGKLVAKSLFKEQRVQTSAIRRLVSRVVDAIKQLLRRFRRDEVQNAIFDANQISSKIAREMLGGKLLDEMSVDNIRTSGEFYNVKTNISDKNDILSQLLKTELKRLSVFKKRLAYSKSKSSSEAISATEAQIAKLEAAIKNYKTEDAIISYMNDSIDFLASAEKSLDDAVASGRPMNSVCRKLNTIRDTLYSFSAALSSVNDAIVEGEIIDSAGLTDAIEKMSNLLNKFHQKYTKIARTYFEEMLSNVYGESGKTITVGREKGRTITIKEMARKADHDISLASRWFNSLADCNDYVLRAIDDVTRSAKQRARKRAYSIRPRIEVAIAELEKATGSRNQDFMFEYTVGEDGKKHKTGKYISAEEASNLPEAQRKFYNTIMDIKREVDKFLPESLVDDLKIIMVRKYTMDRFKDAEGAKGKALEAWEGLKNRIMETSDDLDYDNQDVAVDFEGNRVDSLPVKFLLKGKKESFDDMTDDVATSLMAYAGMACEYGELNGVIGILENAKYMSSEREVTQKTGTRTQRENIQTDNYEFQRPFTVKQANTNSQKALEDFFQMHIYGHIRKNEGTIGRTRISKRKVVDTLNSITSLSQMAINLPQRIANISTGLTQVTIESIGHGAFSTKDVAWASGIYVKESGDRLAETGKTDYDNKLSLWNEYFDVLQNNGRNDTQYKKGRLSRIFNSSLLYAGLTMGEDYLASMTSLALARNYKVKGPDGKQHTLWDAYEVKYTDPTNKRGAYLGLKSGYTNMDGSAITAEDEQRFSKRVSGFNFELQGIYNLDDKSAVQQYAFGALIIMYRKWIAPALKRRYAGVNYNVLKGDYQEGYYSTLFRTVGDILRNTYDQVTEEKGAAALFNIIEDLKALRNSIAINWSKLTDYEKSNLYRAFTELGIVLGLTLSISLVGKVPPGKDPEDDRSEFLAWWDNTVLSQMLRLRTEIGSQAPTPMMVDEALHLLKSPFAAIGPLQNAINSLQLLLPSNYMTEIKSGRYRGHTKAYKYFRELPVISMFKKVDNFLDPSSMIQFYKNNAY